MSFENVLSLNVVDRIAFLTIERPDALNALNKHVFTALDMFFSSIDLQDIGAVIITGSGEKAFAAGADIKEFSTLSKEDMYTLSRRGQIIFSKIEKCPIPIIAAVNGYALGGGLELAMACHVRLASDNAMFGLPECKLGIVPGYGGSVRLPRLIGDSEGFKWTFSGDMYSAEYAHSRGLVSEVHSPEELLGAATKLAKTMLKRAPLAQQKVVALYAERLAYEDELFNAEARAFAELSQTNDFKEGVAAFLEKRKASFTRS